MLTLRINKNKGFVGSFGVLMIRINVLIKKNGQTMRQAITA